MGLLRASRAKEIIHDISGAIRSSANADTVYASPVRTARKTIIPVAKVAYGFGAGSDAQKNSEHGNRKVGKEEGGGGGVLVRPMGVIEVTDQRTRYIPVGFRARLLWLLAAGFFTGWAFSRRRYGRPARSA